MMPKRFSEITVPITILNGNVVGVIDSEHPDKFYFTSEDDFKILTTISNLAVHQDWSGLRESVLIQKMNLETSSSY